MKNIKQIFILLFVFMAMLGCSKIEKVKPNNKVYSNYKKDKLKEVSYKKGNEIPYLVNIQDITSIGPIKNLNEKKILEIYKNDKIKGYGDLSPYWRWSVEYPTSVLEKTLNANLVAIKKQNKKSVYTLVGGKWSLKPLGRNPLGSLKEIRVEKRGPSTIAMDLVIVGSKNTFVVVKEYNIRKVLGFSKSRTGINRNIALKGKGKILKKNVNMLPSAFFAIEKKRNSYMIYGGGFGHGVGMPQYSAYDLSKKKNADYKEILNHYYQDVKYSKISSVPNFKGDILVGITNNSSLEHKRITLKSPKNIIIKSGRVSKKISSNTEIEITRWNGNIIIKSKGKKVLTTKSEIRVLSKGKIGVTSIRRKIANKNYPTYYGEFNIRFSPRGNLLLVNKVDVEDYLKGVVVSEMMSSFGLEALKAQAITARTYVANAIIGRKYAKYGINVDDTVASQVYNKQNETEIATEAIRKTKKIILTYEGKPISTYFYSTSSGFSATPKEVW